MRRASALGWFALASWVVASGGCATGSQGADEALAPTPTDDAGTGEETSVDPCGDRHCDETGGETCTSCAVDCGDCASCTAAPTCTGAFPFPSAPTALASFDNAGRAIYVCGDDVGTPAASCSSAQLKVAVRSLVAHRSGTSGANLFCVVTSDDGQASELLVTPLQSGVLDGASFPLSAAQGMVWGQSPAVKLSQFNLTLQYDCYELTQPSQWAGLLGAIGNAVGAVGSVPGNPYGWAFGLGGIAAQAAATALNTAPGVVLRMSVQQTISAHALIDLTNGRTWSIRQAGSTGGTFPATWDWELQVESWGCAEPRPAD